MRRYYAIGDVHGCAKRLGRLHERILEHIQHAGGDCTIVHLGDYVDRGPDSKGVIDACIALEKRCVDLGIETHFLMGNHEDMFLHAFRGSNFDRSMYSYLHNGGDEAIKSYTGTDDLTDWRNAIPQEHVKWISSLKLDYWAKDDGLYFVHAGIDPITFPNHSDHTKIWTRGHLTEDFVMWNANDELKGVMVVHGHTPNSRLKVEYDQGRRLNLDTGACFGGKLTCGIIVSGEPPSFLEE